MLAAHNSQAIHTLAAWRANMQHATLRVIPNGWLINEKEP
jgi:hypothetical protein